VNRGDNPRIAASPWRGPFLAGKPVPIERRVMSFPPGLQAVSEEIGWLDPAPF